MESSPMEEYAAIGVDEWPLKLGRSLEGDEDEETLLALESLQYFEENPILDEDFIEKRTRTYLDRLWDKWLKYAAKVEVDAENTWVDLCLGLETALRTCRGFLRYYVQSSRVKRPCLGPEEWHVVQKIKSAATLEDVWAGLITNADKKILQPKRNANRLEASLWVLKFSSRKNSTYTGPAREVAKSIPKIAKDLGLSLRQLFVKRETTPEDILLILHVHWIRAKDIRCIPSTRVAFHTAVVIAGIGGWRPASIVGMEYTNFSAAWVRDPDDPTKTHLVGTLTIEHVKQKKHRVERNQRSTLDFSFTWIPCRPLCLLTLLITRALADDAFAEGFRTFYDVVPRKPLEPGIDYVPLRWRPKILEGRKAIVPISYETYWALWNRTLFVAGLRSGDEMRPYAMRVGAGDRLDGSLEPTLRNFVLSNSSQVFEESYLPVHLRFNLIKVAYADRAGDTDAIVALMSRALMRRDPNAPIYITEDDLAKFEVRRDISRLRATYKAVVADDPDMALKIAGRIKYLVDTLTSLKLIETREAYFKEADQLRVRGLSTDHLYGKNAHNPRRQKKIGGSDKATQIGEQFSSGMSPEEAIVDLTSYIIYGSDDDAYDQKFSDCKAKKPTTRCLICGRGVCNKSSLTRHVNRFHQSIFEKPFQCPECLRMGKVKILEANPQAWSSHVSKTHGKMYVPNLRPRKERPAYCPLCEKSFTVNGFALHYQSHETSRTFPLKCPECAREGRSIDHHINDSPEWLSHVRNAHGGEKIASGAIMRAVD